MITIYSMATATKNRPHSQKKIAFSGSDGVTKTGIPANDNIWAKSINTTVRKAVAMTIMFPDFSLPYASHPTENIMAATIMENVSMSIWRGR